MKKSFLLLLLPLFALASWAQPDGVYDEPVLVSSPITWDGTAQTLIATPPSLVGSYNTAYAGGNWNTGGWSPTYYTDDPAGIQYYVRSVFDDAPVDGNSGNGQSWNPYRPAMHGITDIVNVTATEIGQYQVWYRVMSDGGSYSTSNWVKLGTINIVAPTSTTKPYYESTGVPTRNQLTYNDEEQELITAGTQTCAGYDIGAGGVRYVVKDTEGMPTASEIAAATPAIPKKKEAGTYYVYYQLLKDNATFTEDGLWTEVGVGGVTIAKRDITEADFTVTFAGEKVYLKAGQALVTDFAWTNTVSRSTTVEYIVNDEEPSTGTPVANPQGKDVGDYTLRVVMSGDANHNPYASAVDFGKVKITPADYVFDKKPAANTGLEYNGTAQNLLYQGIYLLPTEDAGTVKYTLYKGTEKVGEFDAWDKVKATNAGTYKVEWTYTADAPNDINWNEASGTVENIVIDKADWTLNAYATIADFAYDGDEHVLLNPAVEATGFIAADVSTIHYYINGGSAIDEADVKAQNVGEYEVSYSVEGTDNFNEIATTPLGTVKISKIKLHVGAQGHNVAYDSPEAKALTYYDFIQIDDKELAKYEPLSINELKDALVKFVSFDGATFESGKITKLPEDVGAWDFVLEADDADDNYEIVLNDFIPNGTYTITAIDATPATVAAATLTYNGADQELLEIVDATTLDGGEMMYYLAADKDEKAPNAGDGKWLTTIPTGKDAGDYYVWSMVAGDNNHNDVIAASAIKVTITQKALAITIAAKSKTYGEDDPKFTATYDEFATGESAETIGLSFTRVDDGEDVGTYAITPVWDATKADKKANYAVTVANGTLTIGQKALAITIADKEKVYGDPDPAFTASYDAFITGEDATTIGLSFERVNKSEDVTTVGNEYEITPVWDATKADKAANYAVTVTNGKLTINKAQLVLEAADKEKVYEDPDPEFTLANTPDYKWSDNAEKIGLTFSRDKEGTPEGENVGEYDITPAATSGNYEYVIYTGKLTITKQPVEPTAPTANVLTYNGQNQALIKAGSAKGSTVEYAIVAIDGVDVEAPVWAEAIPEAKNAGTYTVKYQFTPGDNFSITDELASDEFDVKILQAKLRFRMGKQEETYTGEAFEPAEGEAYTLSEGGFFAGDEDVLTFAFEEGFDATTACEEGRAFDRLVYTFKDGIANYTVGFENEGLLIIKKAAPADFTAPAANDLTYNGLSQKLVTEGSVAKVDDKPLGTIMFSNKKDGEYTTAVPEGTDAKKYDVWFKVVGDANHKDTDPKQITEAEIKPFALFADMIKAETLSKPYTAAVQSFPMSLKVKLAADKKDPRTLVEKQDYTVKINGKEVKDVTIKDAGDYVYTFTGKGNYTGEISTTAKITKLELIATAPNAEKTYDGTAVIEPEEFKCTATQLKLYGGLEISGLLADDKIDLGDKTIADIIVPEGSAINVGEYNLKVNLAAIPVQANYTFNAQTFNGKLTINKAEAVKIGFFTWEEPNTEEAFWGTTIVKTKEYSKSYGTADPVFITEKGTNDVTSISGDLMALEGELFEDNAVVATLLGATRTAGEVYTKDGYTVKLGWKNTSNTAELAKIATFKNNYKNVTFGTTKLNITPFEGTIKVSIKSMATTFDGNDHAGDCTWAADLSNMVVVGMQAGKNKNEIFTELPKITVTPKDGKVRNAGDYNITLSGGKSDNYDMKKVQFVLGSYLTVEPFEITPDMVTIPDQQVKIGDKAKDVIKHDAFTFAEGALPVAEDANLFQVVAAPDFIDANGKIKLGENPAEGLILARKDNTNAEALNYTGYDEVFGYLSIIGTPDLLVLDDTKDIATKDRENTDVTFTNRSIRQDDWNVLCLPFDATIKEISDAFGYAAVDLLKKESVDGSMHFVVTTSGTVPAGEPFIIKPTSDPELNAKSNFVQVKFTGVTVKEFSDNPEPVKDSAGNKFCGTFKAQTTFFGEKFWYMSKGEWKQASNYTEANPVKLGAYRAYIETATAGARIFIEEPDGSITAINAIDLNNNTMDEGWYTVNGMKLNAAPTQKGTYIKDGKKVFVK